MERTTVRFWCSIQRGDVLTRRKEVTYLELEHSALGAKWRFAEPAGSGCRKRGSVTGPEGAREIAEPAGSGCRERGSVT